jgi:sugar lactone lactonase YvrE
MKALEHFKHRRYARKKYVIFAMILLLFFAAQVYGIEVKIINPKAAFPEGPIWKDGKLYYVEYGAHAVMSWDGAQNSLFCKLDGCGPSAIIALPSDEFLVTCYDSGSIARLSRTGEMLNLYTKDNNGREFVGPNDFTIDGKGGVYFTASGPWESEPIEGKIYHMDSKAVIKEVADDLHYANGLALSNDGKILYLAESEAFRVIIFDVQPDHTLTNRRRWISLGLVDPEAGPTAFPDGLKFDSKGNLYIASYSKGRIAVVSPNKKLVRTIDVPSPAAPNLTFGSTEEIIYVMAVDDQSNAPYWGKVYEVRNK